jgi:DeoR/GlpR family transcriptional regulator of sugar metabolism
VAFLGGEGIVAEGVANSHAAIVEFQLTVAKCSAEVFFCLDATKLGHATVHPVVPWTQSMTLITDANAAALKNAGIPLRSAQLSLTH